MGRDPSFIVLQGFVYEDFIDDLEPLFKSDDTYETIEDYILELELGRVAWENSEELFIGSGLQYYDWDDGFIKEPQIPTNIDKEEKQIFINSARNLIDKDNKELIEKIIELYENHCKIYAYCDFW